MSPAGNNDLAALEEELKQAMLREEYLDAIDVYEEIEKTGMIQPRHLLGWGECLVKLRRKQDARQAWIRAYQMDTGFQPVIKALNENFPGWKKSIPTPKPVAPPRPAAPIAAPPRGPAQAPIDESGNFFEEVSPTPQPMKPPVAQPARMPSPAALKATYSEAEINWRYVLEDVAEARAATESRAFQDAAS